MKCIKLYPNLKINKKINKNYNKMEQEKMDGPQNSQDSQNLQNPVLEEDVESDKTKDTFDGFLDAREVRCRK